MRPALQRLLTSPSTLVLLRNAIAFPTALGNLSQCTECRRVSGTHDIRRNASAGISGSGHLDIEGPQESEKSTRAVGGSTEHRNLRGLPGWREQLTTFEQFEYESEPDNSTTQRRRLVDDTHHQRDFELWLELLRFRRRRFGVEGITPIWNDMRRKGILLPTTGPTAYEIWNSLLQLGQERPEVLKELWMHAKILKESLGRSWPYLYLKIVGRLLQIQPTKAYSWHCRLSGDFSPSPRLFRKLFEEIVTNPPALAVFKRIYIELSFREMYKVIIPALCEREMYALAIKWHHLLMRMNDLPSNSAVVKPLLYHLAMYGDEGQLMKITKGMVDAGVSFAGSIDTSLKPNTLISREMMNRLHGESHNIAPRRFSDEFCARLFATRMFSIDMVINGLRMLGVDAIGPLSLREIANRERKGEACHPETMLQYIERLRQAGISIGTSVFSRLVEKLAIENQGKVLDDVVTCDQHPEAFEDWKLQESLLAAYYQSGDQRQVNRTLAILMLDSREQSETIVRWNLLLRSCLTRQDWRGTFRTIESMRENNIPLTAKSSGYVRLCMLSRRQVSRKPSTTDDLRRVINIWQGALRLGGRLPSLAWVEILRRLGMAGRLQEYENLALWLAAWYSDPAFRASQTSLTFKGKSRSESLGLEVPTALSKAHPRHPLRIIFSPGMQGAIIAWGFQDPAGTRCLRQRKPAKLVLRAASLEAPWTWGLKLLNKLKAYGTYIDRTKVASACRQRLLTLFGPGVSKRPINRQAKSSNTSTFETYVLTMDRIWGGGLFQTYSNRPCLSPESPPPSIITSRMLRTAEIRRLKGEVLRKGYKTAKRSKLQLPKRMRDRLPVYEKHEPLIQSMAEIASMQIGRRVGNSD
ncbi:hypothetical protein MMC24_003559 [Lignoscripta atroalba]|nr:hypothetical protein [Lignoscripta atroalba]